MTKEDITEWYKSRVRFYESDIKSLKECLQDVFKNGKNWACSEEDLDWYKSLVRELKNSMESAYKDCMLEYKHHREGLNPPCCYERMDRRSTK